MTAKQDNLNRSLRWVLPALACCFAASAFVPGCGPAGDPFFYREDFEELCEGTPCGWLQVRGEAGGVTLGETLPGDGALVFSGDGMVARGEGGLAPSFSSTAEELVLSSVSRCDIGSSLRVEFTFERLGGMSEIEVRSRDLGAFNTFDRGPLPARFEPSLMGSVGVRRVLAVLLFKSGGGECELASMTIERSPGLFR